MLNQDFKDILSTFIEEKVEFMVVGGYAMAFHGYVRATGDIDLWIRISEQNSDSVWRALESFGAPLFDLNKSDLLVSGIVFQMGVPPNRIDIINQIDGVDFEEAFSIREEVQIDDLKVPVISKQHLLINKKATNRPKDLNDVLWLENE